MDVSFLSLLACPKCRGALTLFEDQTGLLCGHCQLVYPVENDIPLLLKEESIPHASWQCRPCRNHPDKPAGQGDVPERCGHAPKQE